MSAPDTPVSSFDRRRWFTTRAVVAHVALAVWVPGCAVACWWQVGIGLAGDSLGWVYSVMWPCFALFGTVFWWHFVHDDPATIGRRGLRRLQQAATANTDDDRSDGHPLDDRDMALARAEAEDPELRGLQRLSRRAEP